MEGIIDMMIVVYLLVLVLGLQIQLRNVNEKVKDILKNPQNHLICSVCGAIADVEIDVDKSLIPTEKLQQDFKISGIYIDFYGVCRKCRNINS